MKIFRSLLEAPQGQFLVDAEHENKKLKLLRVHPVVDGIVWAAIPLCQLENVEVLIKTVQAVLLKSDA
jgi:hypothetical protein